MIFTVIFIVSTVIIMILIYYYNVRHKYEEPDELDEYVVEKRSGEKTLYESSDKFDWELYESDMHHDYDLFVGLNHYKNAESAKKRIEFLKKSFQENSKEISLSMLESMILVKRYGEDITLDESGTYRLKKIQLDNFIETLDYDLELIDLIKEIKDEIEFSLENYQIDVRTVFYIMRNAKSLGLYNINNNSQFFLFAKRKGNKIIQEKKEEKDLTLKEMSEIRVITEEFSKEFESEKDEEKSESSEIQTDEVFDAFLRMQESLKIEVDASGNRVVEYSNGQKIIRSGLWGIEAIEEERSKKDFKYSESIEEESADEIMRRAAKEKRERDEREKNKRELNDGASNDSVEVSAEGSKKPFVRCASEMAKNSQLKDGDANMRNLLGFFGEVKSVSEYMKNFKSLSDENLKVVVVLLLNAQSLTMELSDERVRHFFIKDEKSREYVCYEAVAYILLLLVANREEFLLETNSTSDDFSLRYPAEYVKASLAYLRESGMDFFKEDRFIYFKENERSHYGMKALELTHSGQELASLYNAHASDFILTVQMIKKSEFKTLDDVKKKVIKLKYFS